MPFYRYYDQKKVLLKNEELEVIASMVGDIPDLFTIIPVPKGINLNQFLYPILVKEFPFLEIKLWWRPYTADKVTAKVEVVGARA